MVKNHPRRVFSDQLKRKIVGHLESGKASVLQVSREYEVSETSVYRWLEKYSRTLRSSTKIVVEMEASASPRKPIVRI